jgi:polysaccharide pyruvyl transferase WcaK-like protein
MIHHVFANRSNAGDWLSARGIQSLLAPLSVTEHLCDEPFVPETLAALAQATPQDFIIIGGGGLFMDYFVPFWEGFRPIGARVPFVLWGVGYCDMKRQLTRPPTNLLEEIIVRSQLCIVRDELTRGHLLHCALPPPVPCPSLVAVPTAPAPMGRRLLHVDHYDIVGHEIYEVMVAMGEAFAERTGRSYRRTNNLIPAGNRGALEKVLELYCSADLVLASRLHGCILALATGRKVLAVSGDHKVESFMAAAGLREWVCDLAAVDTLPQRLQALSSQVVPAAFVEKARAQNRAVAEQVRSLIDEHGRARA